MVRYDEDVNRNNHDAERPRVTSTSFVDPSWPIIMMDLTPETPFDTGPNSPCTSENVSISEDGSASDPEFELHEEPPVEYEWYCFKKRFDERSRDVVRYDEDVNRNDHDTERPRVTSTSSVDVSLAILMRDLTHETLIDTGPNSPCTSENVSTSEDGSVSDPEFELHKEMVIEQEMVWFKQWLDERLLFHLARDPADHPIHTARYRNHAENSGRDARSSPSVSLPLESRFEGIRRRGAGDGGGRGRNNEDDEFDEDPRGSQLPRAPRDTNNSNSLRRFACPFFKRNPRRYHQWRSCPGPGWASVHRIKEHLYRRHRIEKSRCRRCGQHFNDSVQLTTHLRMEAPCPVREVQVEEGLDEEQERKLRSRKRHREEKTEAQKWADMYRILFPDDNEPPSPCK